MRVSLKWASCLGVAFFVVRALVGRLGAVSWGEVQVSPQFAAMSAACLVGGALLCAVAYRQLVACFCRPPDWPAMLAIAWIPAIAKYVPGKFASVAGAVWMLCQNGVPGSAAVSVVFMLTGLSTVVGLLIAVPLTLWQMAHSALPAAWLWCLVLFITGATCLHPRLFLGLGNHILCRLGRQPVEARLRLRDYASPVVLFALSWVMVGCALWLVARSVTNVSLSWMPLFVPAAALASTVGFLAFFAPAGMGVREGILLIVLGPIVGIGPDAVVVIAMRLLQVLVEVVLAMTGVVTLRLLSKSAPRAG